MTHPSRGTPPGPPVLDFGIPPQLARRMSMAEQHEYLRTKLSRRRTLVTAGSFAAGGVLTGCGGPDSSASPNATTSAPSPATSKAPGSAVTPFGRHLAFGADPKTQMRISWQVPLAVRKPYLRVGLKPEELTRKVEAEVRDLHTPGVKGVRLELEQYYLHAALDGLRPGTTYYYGVGHEGFDPAAPAHRATIGTFRTAPAAPETFVFTAFGDQGVGKAAAANDNLIVRQKPAFHLHAGDICYADGNGKGVESDGYDPGFWDLFLKQNEPVARSVPWMVTTGNHDMEAWYSPDGYGGQLARWSLPDNGFDPRSAPGVYAFTYGNVGFVALDANDVSYEIPANLGYSGGRQTKWLDAKLKELRAAKGVDFVVVFFHHCAYSTSSHASDGGVRDAWLPLFAKHQVDLVINGHNHVYERTDAVKGGEVGRPVPVGASTDPTRDGTVYVTAGGGGRDLYGFPSGVKESYEGHVTRHDAVETFAWTKSRRAKAETVEWSRVRYRGFSLLSVEAVSGARPALKVSALAQNGDRVDHFEVRRGA
ncbi:metallophosphoesterase family protein [Streptomyces caniscabiei]|uniref:Metallophosphoesterase family protein n=1 Tax=Streptomyces caniscabiei TaxID=2746961 RepID=A0A927QNJ1_9ACTN|nr:metallophosphoesterase family protein [Streptomyces caniscabiei]MBD9726824.1 metallophosphoesterase family protein [Streptomyces caniscabiei]MDX3515477.1 metallophosphoesterase family protein [Streptomyces caniscabiei]MDX3724619.1 metallophosphoesterase family protein [Streptomyces caniscabiei]WEO23949.1 metallophosphoesterase family protein [Streptomyces caniscabiei]